MEKKVNISSGMWKVLFFVVGSVDALQIFIAIYIPVLGWVTNITLNIFIGIPLTFYLHIKGVSMFKGRVLLRFILAFAVDEATAGLAPAWTIALYYTYRSVKAQENPKKISSRIFGAIDKVADAAMIAEGKRNQGGVRLPASARIAPLNQDGVRRPQARPPLNTPMKDSNIRRDFSPKTNQQDIDV